MPLMKFNLEVRYPRHTDIYASPGDIINVPHGLVLRFLRRGAELVEDTKQVEEVEVEEEISDGTDLLDVEVSDEDLLGGQVEEETVVKTSTKKENTSKKKVTTKK